MPAATAPPSTSLSATSGDGAPAFDETPRAEIVRLFQLQQAQRGALDATDAPARARKIRRLREALLSRREDAHAAMHADFRKPAAEVDLMEIGTVNAECKHAEKHLKRWMKPRKVKTPLQLLGTKSEIRPEPKGVGLIIAPWNYPINLTLGPLVGAVAAGCPVVIKPSEMTPHTNAFLADLLGEIFPESEVAFVPGAVETAKALLAQPFDHIYFTGSPSVGKIVMRAAADHLASVTLELGGKSPAIICADADLEAAAKRVAWGKFTNAAQTCIAPDYVLVERGVHDEFARLLAAAVAEFYGATEADRKASPDYPRMISDKHFDRMRALLRDAEGGGATPVTGGTQHADAAQRYLPPTLLTNVPEDAEVMREELFGPLLPILPFDSLDEALGEVNARPNPLALYLFTASSKTERRVLDGTTAGTSAINDTLLHFSNVDLPFGGAGFSGIGRGHGEAGFLAFSNERAVLRRTLPTPAIEALYPPYGGLGKRITDALLRWL